MINASPVKLIYSMFQHSSNVFPLVLCLSILQQIIPVKDVIQLVNNVIRVHVIIVKMVTLELWVPLTLLVYLLVLQELMPISSIEHVLLVILLVSLVLIDLLLLASHALRRMYFSTKLV